VSSLTSSCCQVTEVDDSSGVIKIKLAEMVVGNLNLRYVDRKTGEVREEGATRPEVILRQLATRPGQVRPLKPWTIYLRRPQLPTSRSSIHAH
jgi:hypothetical protein